jgi:hypothetical protein
VTISLPGRDLDVFASFLRGRTLHNRECALSDGARTLQIVPAEGTGWRVDGQALILRLTEGLARRILNDLASPAEVYSWPQLPGLLLKTGRQQGAGA